MREDPGQTAGEPGDPLDGEDEQRSRVSPRSRLGEKLTYIANQWGGLLVFHGRVSIDSNFVENLTVKDREECTVRGP